MRGLFVPQAGSSPAKPRSLESLVPLFFTVSKVAWFFAAPTNLLVSLAVLGAALLATRRRHLGRALTVLAAVGLCLIGISPLPKVMMRPLEDRFPIVSADERPIDGIILLGGAAGLSRDQVVFNDAASRMTTAVGLALAHPEARIVFSGGDAGLFERGEETEAEAAAKLFALAGIAPSRVLLEDQSRNTRENALFTRRQIAPKPGERWLLITSAFHMPRAVACFRAVGLEIEPYPVDFRTKGTAADYWSPSTHSSDAMRMADLAVKEWIGLFAYRAAGYTDELLPRPASSSGRREP